MQVRLRRFACIECGHVWTQDLTSAVVGRGKLTIAAIRWGLVALVEHHLSISAIAKALGVAWHTANAAILTAGKALLVAER